VAYLRHVRIFCWVPLRTHGTSSLFDCACPATQSSKAIRHENEQCARILQRLVDATSNANIQRSINPSRTERRPRPPRRPCDTAISRNTDCSPCSCVDNSHEKNDDLMVPVIMIVACPTCSAWDTPGLPWDDAAPLPQHLEQLSDTECWNDVSAKRAANDSLVGGTNHTSRGPAALPAGQQQYVPPLAAPFQQEHIRIEALPSASNAGKMRRCAWFPCCDKMVWGCGGSRQRSCVRAIRGEFEIPSDAEFKRCLFVLVTGNQRSRTSSHHW
jgi:hypothetical protein